MEMKRPHDIVDEEEALRRLKLGEAMIPLTHDQADELREKSVDERSEFAGEWLQQRLDQIRNHTKARPREEAEEAFEGAWRRVQKKLDAKREEAEGHGEENPT